MQNSQLNKLQQFLQAEVDTAWQFTKNSQIESSNSVSDTLGQHLGFLLQSKDTELSLILDDIAREEYKKLNNEITPEPINFTNYIRYSSGYPNHKEVFVGNEWVIVPADACVEFSEMRDGFRVSISHGNDYATFSNTQTLHDYQEDLTILNGGNLNIVQDERYIDKQEFDMLQFGKDAFNFTKDTRFMLDDAATAYLAIPKEFKRHYAYKISKVAKSIGKPAKAGKIFQGGQKLAKLGQTGKVLGFAGTALSVGTIAYEVRTDTWDAHTAVDGALLVVGIGAAAFGAPLVLVGLAVYGILDYAFDISESIDDNFGRNSDIWNDKPIREFPTQRQLLFKDIKLKKERDEIKIDNTRVVIPKFKKL